MKKAVLKATLAGIFTCLFAGSTLAQGTLIWDWNVTASGVSESGTFTTQDTTTTENSFTGYLITSMTGGDNGTLLSPGSFAGASNVENDNLLSSSGELSQGGVSWNNGSNINLSGKFENGEFILTLPNASGTGYTSTSATFSTSLAPVPEPGVLALAGLGMTGLCYFRRRK